MTVCESVSLFVDERIDREPRLPPTGGERPGMWLCSSHTYGLACAAPSMCGRLRPHARLTESRVLRAPALDDERCCRSVETFNKSVLNMMSIKGFGEIKECVAAPCPRSVVICALAVYSQDV